MADGEKVSEGTAPAAETPAPKAAAIQYGDTKALAQPVKSAPPPSRGGGGGGGGKTAEEVLEACKTLLANRGEWYQVCAAVPNPGKFYDAFRGQGAQCRVAATGDVVELPDGSGVTQKVKTYNIWAMIPEGPVTPWKKGKGKAAGSSGSDETPTVHPPQQSGPPRRPQVLPGSGQPARRA